MTTRMSRVTSCSFEKSTIYDSYGGFWDRLQAFDKDVMSSLRGYKESQPVNWFPSLYKQVSL